MARDAAKWISLALLVASAILSFIDRQILSLLVDPIKEDLSITDTQVGLLQGFAFAIFYGIAAIPFGWLADRSSRKWIIAGGIFFWSLMTAASGFARSFASLFAMRLGVGLGEATLGPSVHSMLSDLFERRQLPLAMSLYGAGVSIGAGLAYLVGGQVVEAVSGASSVHIPIVGSVKPWNAAFFIVGGPGLLLAAAVALFVREPRRSLGHRAAPGEGSLLAFVRSEWRLAAGIIGGLTLLTASGFATLAWSAAFFSRTFAWSAAEAGSVIGLILIGAGVTGGFLAGFVSSRLVSGGFVVAPVRIMAATAALAGVFGCAAFLMPTGSAAAFFLVPTIFFGTSYVGLGPAVVQSVIPPALRGRASAWQLLVTNTIGMIVGPLSVALITDIALGDPARVGISLAVTVGILSAAGGLAIFAAEKPYAKLFAARM